MYTLLEDNDTWRQDVTDADTDEELSTLEYASSFSLHHGTGTECDKDCTPMVAEQRYTKAKISIASWIQINVRLSITLPSVKEKIGAYTLHDIVRESIRMRISGGMCRFTPVLHLQQEVTQLFCLVVSGSVGKDLDEVE